MNILKASPILAFSLLLMACENEKTITIEVPAPDPDGQDIIINVNTSMVSGDFTLNGGSFPNSAYSSGTIIWTDTNTHDPVILGKSYDDNYNLMLINGNYDSVYQHQLGNGVPLNELAIINSNQNISTDTVLNIDVSMVDITPVFTHNNAAFTNHPYIKASFYLQPVDSDELILLGDSNINNAAINVVPGNYHVVYSHSQGEDIPVNKAARILSNVDLSSSGALNINVSSVDLRSTFQLNGGAFPQNQYDHGEFYLTTSTTGDEALIGQSFNSGLPVTIVAGSYDIEYRSVQSSISPINKRTVIRSNEDLSSGGAIVIDVLTENVSIDLSLNGNAFPVSEYADGNLYLVDTTTGADSLLGNTHGEFSNLPIIEGTYDIAYEVESKGNVPHNSRTIVFSGLEALPATSMPIAVNLLAHNITPSVTLNTAAFPVNQYNYGNLLLKDTNTGESFILAPTYNQDEALLVFPGTYDFIYQCVQCTDIPFNSHLTLQSDVVINADATLSANINTARIDVSTTLNNGDFPNQLADSGLIWASLEVNDAFQLTSTQEPSDDIIVAEGLYTFYYQHQFGDQVPQNNWSEVGTLQIDAPPQ